MMAAHTSWKYTFLALIWCFLKNEDAVVAFSRNMPLAITNGVSSATLPSHQPELHLPKRKHHQLKMSTVENADKATLTEDTTWKVRIQFKKIVTNKGKIVSPTYLFDWKFMEDENYEPPQGTIQVLEKDEDGEVEESSSSKSSNLLLKAKGRWTLSEDPDDRKDSLWIWGLFKEPLYPFLLLTLETPEIPYGEEEDEDSIPPMVIYSQIKHRRDSERGAVLPNSPTLLTTRLMETMNADLLGVGKVEVYEDKNTGQITIFR